MRTTMRPCLLLDIDHDRMVCRVATPTNQSMFLIGTPSDILDLMEKFDEGDGVNVVCSSSLDFPHEHTNDERIIDLCRLIRGKNCQAPLD